VGYLELTCELCDHYKDGRCFRDKKKPVDVGNPGSARNCDYFEWETMNLR